VITKPAFRDPALNSECKVLVDLDQQRRTQLSRHRVICGASSRRQMCKFDSNFRQHLHVRIPAARSARGLHIVVPLREGAGNAGCALHPRSRVQIVRVKTHTSIQGSGEHPTFPAQWFDGLSRAHPGVSGSSRLRRLRIAGSSAPGRADLPSADLTPTIEASGPHDFAVRFDTARPHIPKTAHGVDPALQSLFRARCRRVHRNPIPTFGDDGQRPFLRNRMA
jgi:hypothetical protein